MNEDQQSQQQSPVPEPVPQLRNPRNKWYSILPVTILVVAVLVMGFFVFLPKLSQKTTKSSLIPPTQELVSPSVSKGATSVPVAVITANPIQTTVIGNQIAPQITPDVAVAYTVTQVKEIGSNWGIMTINSPSVGNGFVIIKKVNNVWKSILGPGTYFSQQELQSVNAPQAVVSSFFAPVSVTPGS